jgi:protein-S-isoprenylcysteine O-methyltransferase Ste14
MLRERIRQSIGKLRYLVTSLTALLLFSFQQIPVVFTGTWPMLCPLGVYFVSLLWMNGNVSSRQVDILFFEPRLMLGRIIAVIGFVLFVIALLQFIKHRGQLRNSGFYSIVRHPQYLSLIIMAYGISVMANEAGWGIGGMPSNSNLWGWFMRFPVLGWWLLVFPWLVMVVGYVLLALLEESCLIKAHEQYIQYRKEVPFIFPVPHKSRREEVFLSVIIIVVMWFILTLTFTNSGI